MQCVSVSLLLLLRLFSTTTTDDRHGVVVILSLLLLLFLLPRSHRRTRARPKSHVRHGASVGATVPTGVHMMKRRWPRPLISAFDDHGGRCGICRAGLRLRLILLIIIIFIVVVIVFVILILIFVSLYLVRLWHKYNTPRIFHVYVIALEIYWNYCTGLQRPQCM